MSKILRKTAICTNGKPSSRSTFTNSHTCSFPPVEPPVASKNRTMNHSTHCNSRSTLTRVDQGSRSAALERHVTKAWKSPWFDENPLFFTVWFCTQGAMRTQRSYSILGRLVFREPKRALNRDSDSNLSHSRGKTWVTRDALNPEVACSTRDYTHIRSSPGYNAHGCYHRQSISDDSTKRSSVLVNL